MKNIVVYLLFAGVCIVFWLQLIVMSQNETKINEAVLQGENNVRQEAVNMGYARYVDDEFVWNTDIFEKVGQAIDCVIKSEERSKQFAAVCLRMANVSIQASETVAKIEEMKK